MKDTAAAAHVLRGAENCAYAIKAEVWQGVCTQDGGGRAALVAGLGAAVAAVLGPPVSVPGVVPSPGYGTAKRPARAPGLHTPVAAAAASSATWELQ